MSPLTPEQTRSASEALDHVFQAFVEEIGEEPTLGEFLEILGLSFQPDENLLPGAPFPLLFKAKKTGNRWYKAESSERVASLNDNTFNEAGDFLNLLVAGSGADPTHPSSVADLADHVLDVLQFADRAFSDIAAQGLQALVAPAAKKTARVTVGDVVAIPAVPRGHHLAIVLCEDQMGTAVGLLEGVFSPPRVGDIGSHRARHIPVYTGPRLIKNRTWPIVGHYPELLELFPDPPEVYWQAKTSWGEEYGEYGGAGKPDGEVRLLDKAEAEAVGLLDGTYRQTYLEEYFQEMLNEGRFDNGPAPRSWL